MYSHGGVLLLLEGQVGCSQGIMLKIFPLSTVVMSALRRCEKDRQGGETSEGEAEKLGGKVDVLPQKRKSRKDV